ncbi:LCP family protein [Streptomyces sp. NPDC101194]|uniref:LCP family protein n=1 Tax=Streptomyces sp. NPDC101194 TaxID=3366127 RepID=UPI003812C00D
MGRSDTAFLLHVYGDRRHAVAVSIPRDSLVDIPACTVPTGEWTAPQHAVMFNGAFSVGETAEGNPACTQNTVEHLTGLRVDHTVVVDFAGFAALTSAAGGGRTCVPSPRHPPARPQSEAAHARRPDHRRRTADRLRALDYVRPRHGIGDGSDMGRIKRQQAFVASFIKKVKSRGLNPGTLLPLADALWAALKADRTVDGRDAGGKGPAQGGGADGRPASPTAAAPVSGKGIPVAVHNGTKVAGLAARAAEQLRSRGFTVTTTATAGNQDHAATVIEFGPGLWDEAGTTARFFRGARTTASTTAGIRVVLGSSFARNPVVGSGTPTASAAPSAVSGGVRSADDDPCADLSYG